MIERPQEYAHGDFAFPCFILAKAWKKSPQQVAQDLVEKLSKQFDSQIISQIICLGPYVNFFVNPQHLASELVPAISIQKEKFGA